MILPFDTRRNVKGTHYISRKKREAGLADADVQQTLTPSRSQIAPGECSQVLQRYNGDVWLLHSAMHILCIASCFSLRFSSVWFFKSPSTYYTSTVLVKPLYHAKLIIRPSIHGIQRVLEGECGAVVIIGLTDCKRLRVHTIQKEVSSFIHKTR